jgi:hypothetical protein
LRLFPAKIEDDLYKELAEQITIQSALKTSTRQRKHVKQIPISDYIINFSQRIGDSSPSSLAAMSSDSTTATANSSNTLSSTNLLQLYFANSKSANQLVEEKKKKSNKDVIQEVYKSIPSEKFERHFFNY